MKLLLRCLTLIFALFNSPLAWSNTLFEVDFKEVTYTEGNLNLTYVIINRSQNSISISSDFICPSLDMLSANILDIQKVENGTKQKLDFIGGYFYPVNKLNKGSIDKGQSITCQFPVSKMYRFPNPIDGTYSVTIKEGLFDTPVNNILNSRLKLVLANGNLKTSQRKYKLEN